MIVEPDELLVVRTQARRKSLFLLILPYPTASELLAFNKFDRLATYRRVVNFPFQHGPISTSGINIALLGLCFSTTRLGLLLNGPDVRLGDNRAYRTGTVARAGAPRS